MDGLILLHYCDYDHNHAGSDNPVAQTVSPYDFGPPTGQDLNQAQVVMTPAGRIHNNIVFPGHFTQFPHLVYEPASAVLCL